jgi:hypothetical protein
MANFAVIENGIVLNTIVADSKTIAEEVTGATCVAYTTEPAETGGTYENNTFIKRKPYSSWVLEDNEWVAPVAIPEFDQENPKFYSWNEETISWVEVSE